MDGIIQSKDLFGSEDIFRRLFEQLPVAIFLINPQNSEINWPIILCNKVACEMHGYVNKNDLRNSPLSMLLADPNDFTGITKDAYIEGKFVSPVNHRKRNGTIFPVSYSFSQVHLKGIEFLMIVMQDLTNLKHAEDRFRAIFENSPDGIVIIDPTQGVNYWPIEDCNKKFLDMNGYENPNELIGKDIRMVASETSLNYVKPGDEYRREFYKLLKENPLINMHEVHTKKDGSTFYVELSSCLITLNGQERVLGIDRDITAEEHLRKILQDLQIDVGRTFHIFTSTLMQIQFALESTIDVLGPNPFNEGVMPSAPEIWEKVVGLRDTLVTNLVKFLDEFTSSASDHMASTKELEALFTSLSQLTSLDSIEIIEYRISGLQLIARQVVTCLETIQYMGVKSELLREVRHSAEQLERLTCLIRLRNTQDRVVEADYLIRDVRERVITPTTPEENVERCEYWDLVMEALKGLADYATYKGVEFKVNNQSGGAYVRVARQNIVRALTNLLDNAIKYSWWRTNKIKPWIDINCNTKEGRVYIEIEDFGVPIPQNEIDHELIFQLGYRGRLSWQRSRPGTGIGLFDARAMARRYGGDVEISSRPASEYQSKDDELKVPHLVTVRLYLPISKD